MASNGGGSATTTVVAQPTRARRRRVVARRRKKSNDVNDVNDDDAKGGKSRLRTFAVLEIFSPSSSSSERGERGGLSSSWTVRRAIEVSQKRRRDEETTTSKEEEGDVDDDDDFDDAWERTKNALVDARATTAIGEMLFSSLSPSPSASRQKSVARLCREETRTRERKSDDETKKETGEDEEEEEEEEEEEDGRGFAFLMKRKNFATGNQYWTIVAKAYGDNSSSKQPMEESKKNGSKKTTKEENKKNNVSNNTPNTSPSSRSTTTPIKTRSFRIHDPSEDPDGAEAKEKAVKFSLSKAFNEWLHDRPIAKNPRKSGLGGSRKRAMKHPCAYTGEMGEDFIDCACGDNEEYGFMLACETCGAWEHGECCGVKSEEAIPEEYECSTCVREKNVVSFPRQLLVDLDDDDDDVKKKEDDPGEEEENEALVQDMIKKGEIIEDDDWGLQSYVAKALGIDPKTEFALHPNSQSSNSVSAKRRCVCCVCGCEHTDEIEPMVKACNCLGGGAIAHRDCLEDWEDEDKCISKNVDKSKKCGTTENRGSENRKTKMVDGIIVDVIDNASLPVTPSGTRSWKVLDDFPGKKCRACCGFGGLASGGIKNAKEGEAIIQNQKRVLAAATAMYEANAKTMRGNRPGAAKTLLDVKKEDANGVGGTSENKPTKEKKKSGARGGGSPNKKEKKTSDRKLPKLMTNKQDKKPPAAKGTTLIAPYSLNGVKVKKERKKVLHHVSSGENNTTSSILTHIPLKKRRLMMFEEDSRNGMYKQH